MDGLNVLIVRHICGTIWTLAYLLIIRRSFIDKNYGIPLIPTMMNVGWEAFDFFYAEKSYMGNYSMLWLILDLIILYQIIIYMGKGRFKTPFALCLKSIGGSLLWFMILIASEKLNIEIITGAFFQNGLMSILFIHFILKRKNISGQSIYIAILKMAGTAIIYIPVMYIGGLPLSLKLIAYPIYLTIFAGDLAYIFLYVKYFKQSHKGSIWLRV